MRISPHLALQSKEWDFLPLSTFVLLWYRRYYLLCQCLVEIVLNWYWYYWWEQKRMRMLLNLKVWINWVVKAIISTKWSFTIHLSMPICIHLTDTPVTNFWPRDFPCLLSFGSSPQLRVRVFLLWIWLWLSLRESSQIHPQVMSHYQREIHY